MALNVVVKVVYGGKWRSISVAGILLMGLLAAMWSFSQGASASTLPNGSNNATGQKSAGAAPTAAPVTGSQGGTLLSSMLSRYGITLPDVDSSANAGGAYIGSGNNVDNPVPQDAAVPTCSPNWFTVDTPNAVYQGALVTTIAEVGPTDVWAAGGYDNNAAQPKTHPLFEHWDGTAWSVVPAPLPAGGVTGSIHDISVNTSNDIWAVGDYDDSSNNTFELIERWNGTQWGPVQGAHPSPISNSLSAVAVVSTNNVWAVGLWDLGGQSGTLIEQWNGSTWTLVSSPDQGTGNNELLDISVVPGSAGSDMWAVGMYDPTPGAPHKTLTLHFSGISWSYVASPNQGADANILASISAVSPGDVWADGYDGSNSTDHVLVEHWDGSAWTFSPALNPGSEANALLKIYTSASNDVWVSGLREDTGGLPVALVEHWNGTAWSVSPGTAAGVYSFAYGMDGKSGSDVWIAGFSLATLTSSYADLLIEHYDGATWSQSYAPYPPTSADSFSAVSALSANDVWAVGISQGYHNSNYLQQILIEHWDGASWAIVDSPHPSADYEQLGAVHAVSADDVWAVGAYRINGHMQTLILQWNGVAWSQITSPNPGGATHDNFLVGIDAASANNAWAVGSYNNGTAYQTMILNWNGSTWLQYSSPNPGAFANYLEDVAVVPGSNGNGAWAVGYYKDTSNGDEKTLIERWNGNQWVLVSSPNVSGSNNELLRVFALSATDAWTVGSSYNQNTSLGQNVALHWNGSAWTTSPVVQPGTNGDQLFDVSGSAPNDIYAVGLYEDASNLPRSLIEHWNGTAWSVLPSFPSPGLLAVFTGIDVLSSNDIWTVGTYIPTGFSDLQTVAARYHPCVVSCSITFSDVPVGSTFYPYIHCLACLGIINGYADGTFKPNANVTRGQLSKIIANSAGFQDAQPNQMFQDVPISSTFQLFIGRLASRGYISGYPCGQTPNEPCVAPGNLPYFRPNANATRGQISKIDSNAAGYNDAPSGQQFHDVPVGSTYYTSTYRLASRNIMAGYPCGGVGEPCGPGSLPYFRPNNNATRGQTSKIVSGTFFPDCSSTNIVRR